MSFDDAWEKWDTLHKQLEFLVACPEVRDYDNRSVFDREDRSRLRFEAKRHFGPHIRSGDVSRLAAAARALGLEKPMPFYHLEPEILEENVMGRVAEAEGAVGGYLFLEELLRRMAEEFDRDDCAPAELKKWAHNAELVLEESRPAYEARIKGVEEGRAFLANKEEVGRWTAEIERFADRHALWAVPARKLIGLFLNHCQRQQESQE